MRLVAVTIVLLLSLLTGAIGVAQSEPSGTPGPPTSAAETTSSQANNVTVEILTEPTGSPANENGEHMVLYRLTLPPDGEIIGPHTHVGTTVWHIEEGAIGLTINEGEVWAQCAGGCGPATSTDSGSDLGDKGQLPVATEVVLETGDWIVQYDNTVHSYRNTGSTPAVILGSGLYDPSEGTNRRCVGGCFHFQ